MDLIDLSAQNPWWSNKDSILEDEKVKQLSQKLKSKMEEILK